MNLFKGTIYRQTMFAEFEQDIYKDAENDIPLTADYLNDKYYRLNKGCAYGKCNASNENTYPSHNSFGYRNVPAGDIYCGRT